MDGEFLFLDPFRERMAGVNAQDGFGLSPRSRLIESSRSARFARYSF